MSHLLLKRLYSHNLQYYIIHNQTSLTHRQYIYIYMQLPSHRKPANLYVTKEITHPKLDPCFLQLSDLTNVVRQCDKYQYSMNLQARKYNERKSNFEVAY